VSEIDRIVEDEWRKTAAIRDNVEVDVFTIMPNHLHGVLIITDSAVVGDPPGRPYSRSPCFRSRLFAARNFKLDRLAFLG
jgi:hypothetical protein